MKRRKSAEPSSRKATLGAVLNTELYFREGERRKRERRDVSGRPSKRKKKEVGWELREEWPPGWGPNRRSTATEFH